MMNETKSILMIGEIGGTAEEEASEFIKNHKIKKPSSWFYCWNYSSTREEEWGMLGAIISGGKGTAQDKINKMEECGITIAQSPAEIGKTLIR